MLWKGCGSPDFVMNYSQRFWRALVARVSALCDVNRQLGQLDAQKRYRTRAAVDAASPG
jgi:hypothetical protein